LEEEVRSIHSKDALDPIKEIAAALEEESEPHSHFIS
jgi:hypothetical protein